MLDHFTKKTNYINFSLYKKERLLILYGTLHRVKGERENISEKNQYACEIGGFLVGL